MVREVLTISVGQAGVQQGDAVWTQYCAEHGVLKDGKNPETADGSFRCFLKKQMVVYLYHVIYQLI